MNRVLFGLTSTLVLMLGALAASAPMPARAADPIQIPTQYGPVVGETTDFGAQFLGIRYAASPAGANRWTPPTAPTPWMEPMPATEFGATCAQPPSAFGLPSMDEDCLFLNVYTPNTPFPKPVMVWFHGGALTYGQSNSYDPERLVDDGIVVVTVNYRLGALGFLAHPELTAEAGQSGNYGLMDQQFALEWVKNNIAAFGGNPNRVTIFGQSAGALSSLVHLASPSSTGLFDRAIVQSGAITLSPRSQSQADQHGVAVAAQIGLAAGEPGVCDLACLRGLPLGPILGAQLLPTEIGYFPNIDGVVLDQTIEAAFASGDFNQVPVIHGSTRDEGSLFVLGILQRTPPGLTYEQLIPAIVLLNPDLPPATVIAAVPEILARYPLASFPGGLPEALGAVGTDAIFACQGYYAAQLTSADALTFYYEFDDRNAPPLFPSPFPLGAYHASEIPYVGLTLTSVGPGQFDADQLMLSETMTGYWQQFARGGNPNGLFAPFWPPLNGPGPMMKDRVQQMIPPQPTTRVGVFEDEHQCDFWLGLRP